MPNKNYHSTFCAYRDAYYQKLQAEYDKAIDNATDSKKINAHNIYEQNTLRPLRTSFNNTLAASSNFYYTIENEVGLNKHLKLAGHFNLRYSELKSKSKSTLKAIGESEAITLMYDYWHKQYASFGKNATDSHTNKFEGEDLEVSKLKWNAANETEFVQLVYALHEGGFVKHESNEITKLVKDFAKVLNFDLGRNWHINLSTSINKRNADYSPPIFDILKESYHKARLQKLEKNKKNKAK